MIDVDSLDTFIRNQLTVQSGLNANRIRNELSLYGTMLDERVEDEIFDSITPDVPLILFNVSPKSSETNVTETEEDGQLVIYTMFNVHVIIYGDGATLLAQEMIARLQTQAVRSHFQINGLYLERVSEAEQIEEYKNHVMWIRDDFDLDFGMKITINPLTTDNEFNDFSTISTATTNDPEIEEIYKNI